LLPEVNLYEFLWFTSVGAAMISVIIPAYNRREFVVEAVASVLSQRDVPEPFEVIVIDDGSTDGTSSALGQFHGSIRYIFQDRKGVSAARNRGILQSKGHLVAFLDSDDLWLPDKLSLQLAWFEQNPEALLCQTEEIWMRNGKRLNPRAYHKKPRGLCFPLLLQRCLVSPSATVVRRAVFDKVGLFDETLPACEDYDLWLRIGCRYPLGLIEKPLLIKRGGHPDQLSATVPALDRYRIRAIVKLLSAGSLDPVQFTDALNTLREKSHIYAEGCRKHGKGREAEMVEKLMNKVSENPALGPHLLKMSEFLLA